MRRESSRMKVSFLPDFFMFLPDSADASFIQLLAAFALISTVTLSFLLSFASY